jgi:hypothetical protein
MQWGFYLPSYSRLSFKLGFAKVTWIMEDTGGSVHADAGDNMNLNGSSDSQV